MRTTEHYWIRMGYSYGFSPVGFNQIIVFSDEQAFKEIVAANPNMTAIMGADDHTRENYPGVFIAGVRAEGDSQPNDSHPMSSGLLVRWYDIK